MKNNRTGIPSLRLCNIVVRYSSSEHFQCWKCSSELKARPFFCPSCGIIQPKDKNMNYFDVFGLPVSYMLDTQTLTTSFRDLQRLLHPDHFTTKTETEQNYSAELSSLVNKAYTTLLRPMDRGLYMLRLHKMSLEEGEIQMDQDFLMEIMERNENLVEANSFLEMEKLGNQNQTEMQTLLGQVEKAFTQGDIQQAKSLLAKLKYFVSIDDKFKEMSRKEM